MKVSLIIQARMGSSRLPNKVLKKINDTEVLLYMINRIKICKEVSEIIVCTTTNNDDDLLYEVCLKNNIKCFRGSENNVLERFYQLSLLINPDIIIRCTGDCPLIDPYVIDNMICKFKSINSKYYTLEYEDNNYFPDGFGCEIFTFDVLKEAYDNCYDAYDKEHVTPYIVKKYQDKTKLHKIYNKSIKNLKDDYPNINFDNLHLSIDTNDDFNLVSNICSEFSNYTYSILDILYYINNNVKILENRNKINVFDGKGQKLYIEAKKIIPGGTQLLSKRPEMFLPELWPSYYTKANGIEITTLDGIKMKDFCYMAIGCAILGYTDPDVNSAVINCVNKGNISTLNCPSEVELTTLLMELHPWADMARYTRASGDACNMAIRIARAASNKSKVAFCGYHGWHDWYLSANHNDSSSLDNHLIKGLSTSGVPSDLKNTAFPFNYNNFDELLKIVNNHDIGCIIMEPQRSQPPKNNFLQKIRKLCDDKNIILIFDEVSSGFRLNTGGLHLKLGVSPDLAIFGKSLGNGFPSAAVIGKRNVMSSAEDTFISSTFYTESVGFESAIAMINKHRRLNVGEHINYIGTFFQSELKKIASKIGIKLLVSGLPCFTAFSFEYVNALAIQTLYTQKMLERHIIAKTAFYPSYAHKKNDVLFYLKNIEEVFKELKELIDNNNIENNLRGPLAHTGFKRLA